MNKLGLIADGLYLDGDFAAHLSGPYRCDGTLRYRLEEALAQSPDFTRLESDLDEAQTDIDHLKRMLRRIDKAIDENRLDDAKRQIGEALQTC